MGYHGWRSEEDYRRGRGGRKLLGRIRYDGTGLAEAELPQQTGHIHSNECSLVVGDGMGERRP